MDKKTKIRRKEANERGREEWRQQVVACVFLMRERKCVAEDGRDI